MPLTSPSLSAERLAFRERIPTLIPGPRHVLVASRGVGSLVSLGPEKVVCEQGRISDFVYLIERGWIKLCAVSDAGWTELKGLVGLIQDLSARDRP